MNELTLEVLTNQDASSWLSSQNNFQSWTALYRRCPWRTPTLTPDFFKLWFRHYGAEWRPILILGKGTKGDIRALLPLALNEKLITGPGAHQAEYHGWLCNESDADWFLNKSLATISQRFPSCHLRLRYLPPGLPANGLAGLRNHQSRIIVTQHLRPLLTLDSKAIQNALQKKNTRSKVNRLKRQGPLTVKRLTDTEKTAHNLDRIAAMYDFRQGAINDTCPFIDDSHKRAFFLDWANTRSPDSQLDVTCIMLKNQIISALIGVAGGRETYLAILAHSPEFSNYSPGKLQIYHTALILIEEKHSCLDLTPGGDPWKERFATEHDVVMALDVYSSRVEAGLVRLAGLLKTLARGVLKKLGIPHRQIKALLHCYENLSPSKLVNAIRPRHTVCHTYQQILSDFSPVPANENVHINALEDLVLYKYRNPGINRKTFLSDAHTRLESGDIAYTIANDGKLVCCAWLSENQEKTFVPEVDQEIRYPISGAVIHNLYVHPDCQERRYQTDILQKILSDLKVNGAQAVYMNISNTIHNSLFATLGFRPIASAQFSRFLWRKRHKQHTMDNDA